MDNRIVTAQDYDFAALRSAVYAIKTSFPFVRLRTIGKSVRGRDLFALDFGHPEAPKVLYAAAFHGSEHITCPVLLRFCERVCRAVGESGEVAGIQVRHAIQGRGMILIPMVNPDGCEINIHGEAGAGEAGAKLKRLCGGDFRQWNANARGVDINHNFDAGFDVLQKLEQESGIYGPSPRQYGGKSPESEPETAALTALCRKEKIRHVLALHTQGEEIYWRYGDDTPPKAQRMAEIFAASTGYALEAPIGLASHGGFKDWFIKERRKPGFTFELGKGKNPLPACMLDEIYERVEEALMLAAIM